MTIIALAFGIAFFMLELIIPNVIYLNIGIAFIITACVSLLTLNPIVLGLAFVLGLATSVAAVRPRVINFERNRKIQKKLKENYLGKIAQIVETTTKNAGMLEINNERWQARTFTDDVIEKGQSVKIKSCKNIVMYIERA